LATVSTVPVLLVPARQAQVRFQRTGSGSTYVRAWCSVAPEGSELAVKLKEQTAQRVLVYEGDGGDNAPWRTQFDRGGAYTLILQEYVKGAAPYGGGYQNSPDSAPAETKVGGEVTAVFFVGQRMTTTLGVSPDSATLVVWVWDETIRQTTIAAQGEASPAVTAENPTPKARVAMTSAGVTSAVAALVDQTATVIGASSYIPTLLEAIADHMGSASSHATPDTVNPLPASLAADPGQHLDDTVTAALASLKRHMNNEGDPAAGPPFGAGSASFHSRIDQVNAPIVSGGRGQAAAYLGLADLWRSYEAHRVSSVHLAPDTTHPLVTPPKLLATHIAFLAALAAATPSTPPGQSSLATQLIQFAGFEEN
jgi:hypothetical protein